MKILLFISLMAGSSVTLAAKVTCLDNPRIEYNGNGGLIPTTNFEKVADEQFKLITKYNDFVSNCSGYADLRNDFSLIFNKAEFYNTEADTKGVSNRSIRARAARCLSAMRYKMFYLGQQQMKKIGEYAQENIKAGKGMENSVESVFPSGICDAPPKKIDPTSEGKFTGTVSPNTTWPNTTGPNTTTPNTYSSCPQNVSSYIPENAAGWRANGQQIQFLKYEPRTRKCIYSIGGKGFFDLYSK